jgi:protein-L-isoaspartate(D-aspartate) O-methyltransferase
MSSSVLRREEMVRTQLQSRGIRDARVLAAFREVPRERFVSARQAELAYEDAPLPIEEGQTISQPYIVAAMLEAAAIGPDDRVLEVGAGSGYAAAVLAHLARSVDAVERHPSLAALAAARLEQLGLDNARVTTGDGSLGLAAKAPFDAIVVSAGAPEVPHALLDQLAPGGRLVIPVGREPRSQELVLVVRTGDHEYERRSLGSVVFVPLVGAEGWGTASSAVAPHRAEPGVRIGARAADAVREGCEPFDDLAHAPLDALLERIGDARVVLIGESTHGTSEFYALRARITEALIARKGFSIVALEADWADASMIDRRVRRREGPPLREPMFSRFPAWMWRNAETSRFIEWLHRRNASETDPARVASVHGLDLYGMNNSIGAVIDLLGRLDPSAAEAARRRYACFTPWERDPQTYGRAVVAGALEGCERDALDTLRALLDERLRYERADPDAFLDAARNATVVERAEKYFRAIYRGGREAWNLRDRHMFETLLALLEHRGHGARAVVWAHNSHLGNAAATEMGARGELNLGQLARERFGRACYAIGMGTDRGTVAAASEWDGPMLVRTLRPSHPDSYERICHDAGVPRFLLPLRDARSAKVRPALLGQRLERAVGVVYRPETELVSHYFEATLPVQFDEWIWFDESHAVTPLEGAAEATCDESPDTFPFAL